MPTSNVDFWEKKLNGNKVRDTRNQNILSAMGWNVITVWECELKKDNRDETLDKLYVQITSKKETL